MWKFALLIACVLGSNTVEAAEFQRLPQVEIPGRGIPIQRVKLNGPIEAGDVDRLKKLIRTNEMEIVLSLNSNGGDFQAGIALARFLKERTIATTVTGTDQCLSACAIAFLGGTYAADEGASWPARSIESGAKVGFHAPFLDLAEGQYDSERVARAYDRAVRTIVQTIQTAPYMQVAADDVAALMAPQREQMLVLDTAELLGRYSVVLSGLQLPKRFTRSMAVSLCTNGWDLSDKTGWEFGKRGEDFFQLAVEMMEKASWSPKKATFRSTTPFGEDARSMVIPIGPGPEDTMTFCIVDRVKGEEPRVDCRGFIHYERISEAVEVAREWSDVEIPCKMPTIVDPMMDVYSFIYRDAWAFVPPRTPLTTIKSTLDGFDETEEDLAKP